MDKPLFFTNKDIHFLKTFLVMLAALPLCLLLYLFITPEIDNRADMLKVFSSVSVGMLLLSSVVWQKLAALPPYYLSVHQSIVSIPLTTFFRWNGRHVRVKLSEIKNVIHEPKASGSRSNLVISMPIKENIIPGNMALGHMRFEKVGDEMTLVICGLKEKDAEHWKHILMN